MANATSIKGTIHLPGDKSISHRAAMIAAIADGVTRIENYSPSADCEATLECLRTLGVRIDRDEGSVTITGVGLNGLRKPNVELDCGNSGTTMRLLAGILSGQPFNCVLTGDVSLRSRPMGRIIEPLTSMGASIRSNDAKAPLSITGHHPLTAIQHRPGQASAQVKSCILLAGLNAEGETTVIEPAETRDHTERLLRWFGVDVRSKREYGSNRVSFSGGKRLIASDVVIPADLSSAAFFITAAICLEGSEITIPGVGLNPTRRSFVDMLIDLGYDIEIGDMREISGESVATLRVRHKQGFRAHGPLVIEGDAVPGLIDEIPILAVLGTQIEGGLEVHDAAELRVKESDRIAATVENLRRMNIDAIENADGFIVRKGDLRGAEVDSFEDHRIAMAFAIAGLIAKGETDIKDGSCVDVSFPGYFETLGSVIR